MPVCSHTLLLRRLLFYTHPMRHGRPRVQSLLPPPLCPSVKLNDQLCVSVCADGILRCLLVTMAFQWVWGGPDMINYDHMDHDKDQDMINGSGYDK